MKQQFYISYRNLGKPEKTPILGDTQEWADRQVALLKAQGATAIRVHFTKSDLIKAVKSNADKHNRRRIK